MPHLVHLSSTLFKRTPEIHLNGGNLLKNAIKAPSGQIWHHERRKKNAAAVTMASMMRLSDVK
jgi:hypothetical protein